MSQNTNWLLVVAVLGVEACSAQILPPRRTPESIMPQGVQFPPPPPSGVGQVVLDVEDGPTEVRVVTGRWAAVTRQGAVTGMGNLSEQLCITPCVASLPYGVQTLEFVGIADHDRRSDAAVVFSEGPSVYRYALGLQRYPTPRAVGSVLILSGVIAASTGLLLGATLNDGFSGALIGLSIGGLVFTAGGVALLNLFPAESQEGSGVQFAMPPVR
jgi:hypothetical protein